MVKLVAGAEGFSIVRITEADFKKHQSKQASKVQPSQFLLPCLCVCCPSILLFPSVVVASLWQGLYSLASCLCVCFVLHLLFACVVVASLMACWWFVFLPSFIISCVVVASFVASLLIHWCCCWFVLVLCSPRSRRLCRWPCRRPSSTTSPRSTPLRPSRVAPRPRNGEPCFFFIIASVNSHHCLSCSPVCRFVSVLSVCRFLSLCRR